MTRVGRYAIVGNLIASLTWGALYLQQAADWLLCGSLFFLAVAACVYLAETRGFE